MTTKTCGRKRHTPIEAFKDVDWTIPNRFIAEQMGIKAQTVSIVRRLVHNRRDKLYYSPTTPVELSKVVPNLERDWVGTDWTLQDIVIAKMNDVSRERIRQIRVALGKPKSIYHHQQSTDCEMARRRVKLMAKIDANRERFKTMGVKQIARVIGKCPPTAFNWIKKLEVEHVDGLKIHPWSEVNFDLPNKTIQEIWEMPFNLASSYRDRKNKGPAKWYRNYDILCRNENRNVVEYLAAVDAEIEKAGKHGRKSIRWMPKNV